VWDFPAISIKMVNNTENTLALNEAVVESKDSKSTPGALLIWDDLSFAQLVIRNEGWTGVTGAQLQLDIASEGACGDWPTATRYVRKIPLADFDAMVWVPIREYIPSRFLNDEKVCVFGEIVYKDPALGDVTRTIKYKTRVLLNVQSTAAMPPSNFYQVMLHTDRSKEIVRVPLEQQLASKEADHFVVSIGADKSGKFNAQISVLAVGGKEVAKRQIDLNVFVPRSQAKRAQLSN
jgi:hypothetical protein